MKFDDDGQLFKMLVFDDESGEKIDRREFISKSKDTIVVLQIHIMIDFETVFIRESKEFSLMKTKTRISWSSF